MSADFMRLAAMCVTALLLGSTAGAETLPVAVSAERAVSVFLGVCQESADREFGDAEAAMAEFGVTRQAETGTVFSETEDMSFSIQDGPGLGKSCSMVFSSADPVETVMDEVPKLMPFEESPFGLMTLLEGQIIVVYQGTQVASPTGGDSVTYHNLRMLSARK